METNINKTLKEFLKNEIFNLPIKQPEKEDFKTFLRKKLDDYIDKLENELEFLELERRRYSKSEILDLQKRLVNHIKKALEKYYMGKPSEAFSEIKKGLDSSNKNYKEVLRIRNFNKNNDFYRIRCHKENFLLPSKDFFHIPFELRGKVKTQRFSIPGFPSLYISTSLYVCWEELNRPNISEFQVVRLNNNKILKIVDLTPPRSEEDNYNTYYKYLMLWPVILACSISVRNYDDSFKPEYILPQLLLQWVREEKEIDGIAYQTTHMDFSNCLSKGEFLNIVLPVSNSKIRGLCDDLKNKFKITEAASINLANGESKFIGKPRYREKETIKEIELVKGRSINYSTSIFGKLEMVLSEMDLNQL